MQKINNDYCLRFPHHPLLFLSSNAMQYHLGKTSSSGYTSQIRYSHSNSVNQLANWLMRPSCDRTRLGKTQLPQICLHEDQSEITQIIVNTNKDANGDYGCFVEFNGQTFSLTQTFFDPNQIALRHFRSDDALTIQDITFLGLQKHLLNQFIMARRQLNYPLIDLTQFNLASAKFSLREIDFSFTRLNLNNLGAILKQGGKVRGATLIEAPHLIFPESGIPKSLALQLIQLGVDPKSVFIAYLGSERSLGNRSIDMSNFDLSRMDLQNIDLCGVNLMPLSRYEGKLNLNGDLFSIRMFRGQPCVTADEKLNAPFAEKLQALLRLHLDNEISQMTHESLPSPLRKLSPDQWGDIGDEVMGELNTKNNDDEVNLKSLMFKKFYKEIYSNSSSSLQYGFSESKELRQQKWNTFVTQVNTDPQWKPEGIQYGKTHIQGLNNMDTARVHLRYDLKPGLSRIQFVVSSGAGPALYIDIAKAIDQFINSKCNGNPTLSPVKTFKVFSEDQQVGRSDSAVLYLSVPLSDPSVNELAHALHQSIGARIAPINIIGATPINNSYIQGITIPDSSLQNQLFGKRMTSHGAIIKTILIHSYEQACSDFSGLNIQPDEMDVDDLNQHAQFYAKEIWNELGL